MDLTCSLCGHLWKLHCRPDGYGQFACVGQSNSSSRVCECTNKQEQPTKDKENNEQSMGT